MTAKLTDHERWRRELSRWIAKSGVPEAEYLPRMLSVTESLIRLRRQGYCLPDGLPQTLEHLCCHRWEMMTAIARLKTGRQPHRRTP
jgi:hypothetical protein